MTARTRRIGRALAAAFGVGALYVLISFGFFQGYETSATFLLSPIQGVSPILCAIGGLPTTCGCIVAEGVLLAVQPIGDGVQNLVAFVAFAVTLLASWGLWRLIGRRLGRRTLRIDSAATLAIALGLQYGLLALLVIGMGGPFEAHVNDVVATYHLARGGEVGWMPALVATFALYPTLGVLVGLGVQAVRDALARRRARREEAGEAGGGVGGGAGAGPALGLTQLFVLGFIALIAVYLVVVCFNHMASYAVYLVDASTPVVGGAQTMRYEMLVSLDRALATNAWVVLVAWIVCTIACRIEEARRTRPLAALSASTGSVVDGLKRYQEAETAAERTAARAAMTAPIDLGATRPDAEIARLAENLGTMRGQLVSYVDDLATMSAAQERSDAELEMAAAIQQGAVTHDFGPLEAAYGIEVASLLTPAREVGGDFYDVFAIDEARVGFVIGDVSGKGLPAALFMMRALSTIRETMKAAPDVGEAITLANARLAEANDEMLFVTAFAGVLARDSGEIAFVNAGHNPPYIVDGGVRALRTKPMLVLGMLAGRRYAAETVTLAPGARLELYTDGVTEATNRGGALFGDARLAAALAAAGAGGRGDADGAANGAKGGADVANDAGDQPKVRSERADADDANGGAAPANGAADVANNVGDQLKVRLEHAGADDGGIDANGGAAPANGADALLGAMRDAVAAFVGDAPQADDLTVLVIERTSEGESGGSR